MQNADSPLCCDQKEQYAQSGRLIMHQAQSLGTSILGDSRLQSSLAC
jgi:hypothetical protein